MPKKKDHQTHDGSTLAVEVKSRDAVRNAAQLAKDQSMATEGGVIIGKNAPPGLQNQQLIIETIERRY